MGAPAMSDWPRARAWGMSREEYNRMCSWCREHAKNKLTALWLISHPPHADWQGTPLEFAYLNLPSFPRG